MKTCPVCKAQCPHVQDLLTHLGQHSPEERARVSRRQVADLREAMREVFRTVNPEHVAGADPLSSHHPKNARR